MKGNGVQDLNGLNEDQKEIFLTFFENCVRLVADTLQKFFPIWNYDKKKLAASVILYVRYLVFEGTIAWNLRMEEITELHLGKIRDCFTSICQFFSPDNYKNIEKIQTPLKPITLIGNQGQQQYTKSLKNPQTESETTIEEKSQNNKAQRTDSTNIGSPFIKDPISNTQNCYPACKSYINFEKTFQNNFDIHRKQSEGIRLTEYGGFNANDIKKKNSACSVAEMLIRAKNSVYN